MVSRLARLLRNPYVLIGLASIVFFLFFQFRVFSQGIGFKDEGFFVYSSERIMRGQIPYRDFFLTTTPGMYYLDALLMMIFGKNLLVSRVLYMTLVACLLVVLNRLYRFSPFQQSMFLFIVALLAIIPGASAFYTQESILCILLSFLLLVRALERKKKWMVFGAGFCIALSIFFKQSTGGFGILALFFIVLFMANKKHRLQFLLYYFLGAGMGLFMMLGYFFAHNALLQFLYFTIVFAQQAKHYQSGFILHRLLFVAGFLVFGTLFLRQSRNIKIALFVCALIAAGIYIATSSARLDRVHAYMFDINFYIISFLFLFPLGVLLAWKTLFQKHKFLLMNAIVFLALFFGIASSGYNNVLGLTLLPFFLPLWFLSLPVMTNRRVLHWTSIGVVVGYLVLVKHPLLPNISSAQASLTIPFAQGVTVSPKENKEITFLMSYIRSHTSKNETIFCFPYCPMVFFLSGRMSATYYSFFYDETFLPSSQPSLITSLRRYAPKLIIMQKPGYIARDANNQDLRLSMLKKYLLQSSREVVDTENFSIRLVQSRENF